MIKDLVSIICPVYNSEKYLAETIESVIAQTYKNWELILVDDCSTDSSASIIREFIEKDNRIIYLKQDINTRQAIARNNGMKIAKGQYIAFIDSDDIWMHDKLKIQLDFMKENRVAFSFTAYNRITVEEKLKIITFLVPKMVNYDQLLKNTVIGCPTVLIDRLIIGHFEMPNVRLGEDTHTWLSILKNGHIAYGIDIVLSECKLREGSASNKGAIERIKSRWYNLRQIEKLNILHTIYIFTFYLLNAIKRKF